MSQTIDTVYTKDGRCGKLIKKESDSRFLIQLYMTYAEYIGNDEYGGETEFYQDLSDVMIYVDKIYSAPPKELIEPSIIELQNTVKELTNTKKALSTEIHNQNFELKKAKDFTTDLKKWHFDLSQFKKAKRVTMWTKDRIAPFTFELPTYSSRFERIDLNIKISLDGKDKSYIQRYSDWGDKDYEADHIDQDYGYRFDLSDEDILTITHERSEKLPLSIIDSYRNNKDGGTDEKWLTERFKVYKSELAEKHKVGAIESLKKKIQDQQDELEKLTTNE